MCARIVFRSVFFSPCIAYATLPPPPVSLSLSLLFYSHSTSKTCSSLRVPHPRRLNVASERSKQFEILTVPVPVELRIFDAAQKGPLSQERIANDIAEINPRPPPLAPLFASLFFLPLPRLGIGIYCATNGIPFSHSILVGDPFSTPIPRPAIFLFRARTRGISIFNGR